MVQLRNRNIKEIYMCMNCVFLGVETNVVKLQHCCSFINIISIPQKRDGASGWLFSHTTRPTEMDPIDPKV